MPALISAASATMADPPVTGIESSQYVVAELLPSGRWAIYTTVSTTLDDAGSRLTAIRKSRPGVRRDAVHLLEVVQWDDRRLPGIGRR